MTLGRERQVLEQASLEKPDNVAMGDIAHHLLRSRD
ncbi:MAG: Uncharacterised protein [Synechococcus sp. CC9902]|nr:MAG: Uncharacterised protein [Synechococcus sp. CC9902]